MSAPASDVRAHIDALLAVLAGAGLDVYERDLIPGVSTQAGVTTVTNSGDLPARFATVLVERDFGTVTRAYSGGVTRAPWLATIEHFGMTAREAQAIEGRVTAVLESARIEIDGYQTSPIAHRTSDAPEPATIGRWLGTSEWSYHL